MTGPAGLQKLAQVWRAHVERPTRSAWLGLVVVAVLAGAYWAREGTTLARAVAASLLAAAFVAWGARVLVDWRAWRSAQRIVRRVVLPADRRLAGRVERALRLTQRAEDDPSTGSAALARLHLERLVALAPEATVAATARRHARRWRVAASFLLIVAVGVLVWVPYRILDGLNVLVARQGRAPVQVEWLEFAQATIRPPTYLRQTDERTLLDANISVPRGSVISVRGAARRETEHLVLTDGKRQAQFESDGAGEIVASLVAESSGVFRVVARFGDVLIEAPQTLAVRAIPDQAPEVTLRGAPRTVQLGDLERLELNYVATDDHGLSQVDLVLRSGEREERRVLLKLDGTTQREAGGTALLTADPFLARAFLPVLVSVEARDNDVPAGMKWGKSQPIVVALPPIGSSEARRVAALQGAMSPLVTWLADEWRAVATKAASPSALQHWGADHPLVLAARALRRPLDKNYSGARVSRGLSAFIRGQAERLEQAARYRGAPTSKAADVLLAINAAVWRLASHDSTAVSRRLADVADEVAGTASQLRTREGSQGDIARLQAALQAIHSGATELSTIGAAGADIGGVVLADIARLKRAFEKRRLLHAELIARHLSERLRRAYPSFAGGMAGGVESAPSAAAESLTRGSDVDERFDQLAMDLEKLLQEHASNIDVVEQTLSEIRRTPAPASWRAIAAEIASKVRRAVSGLPRVALLSKESEDAALAREHAEAMADGLERLAVREAAASGRDAMSALRAAQRGSQTARSDLERAAMERAGFAIDEALRWIEQRQRSLDQAPPTAAKESLRQASQHEGELADESGRIAERGERGAVRLPGTTVEALRGARRMMMEATRALNRRRFEHAQDAQRQAQELLEQARMGRTTDSGQPETHELHGSKGAGMRTDGSLPEPTRREEVAQFRRRVIQGLSRPSSSRLSPAVQRYAEELLK